MRERSAQSDGGQAMTFTEAEAPRLRRSLTLWNLVVYGVVLIQPTAPMPIFGVVNNQARGHVVTTILLGMVAILFTAMSYGRMAQAYPSAGSAYTYASRKLHPALGHITGWGMLMEYIFSPLICVIWCGKAVENIFPGMPYWIAAVCFALLFTTLNLLDIRTSARINEGLAAGMAAVIAIFFVAAIRYLLKQPPHSAAFYTHPFYDPATFSPRALFSGTSIAVLTYMGFDGISTLSEETHDPRRNILRATILVCVVTGVLASMEVYVAQLIWPAGALFSADKVDTAYAYVAGRAGGPTLFHLVNATLLLASVGSGMGAQIAAARLLYGMSRGHALPQRFFGVLEPRQRIPANNVMLVGAVALAGAFAFSYALGAELLNCGAFIAFMGVNAAAFAHADRSLFRRLSPALGFAICLFLWWNLSAQAKWLGTLCTVGGAAFQPAQRAARAWGRAA
ncbi:MAG: APC family permease [Bryobacteraceae bacterium]